MVISIFAVGRFDLFIADIVNLLPYYKCFLDCVEYFIWPVCCRMRILVFAVLLTVALARAQQREEEEGLRAEEEDRDKRQSFLPRAATPLPKGVPFPQQLRFPPPQAFRSAAPVDEDEELNHNIVTPTPAPYRRPQDTQRDFQTNIPSNTRGPPPPLRRPPPPPQGGRQPPLPVIFILLFILQVLFYDLRSNNYFKLDLNYNIHKFLYWLSIQSFSSALLHIVLLYSLSPSHLYVSIPTTFSLIIMWGLVHNSVYQLSSLLPLKFQTFYLQLCNFDSRSASDGHRL